jgi:CRP/FNR family transcriptional regulator, anaerobic regulatory protein
MVGRRSALARVAGLLLALATGASHSPCHIAFEFELPLTRGEMAVMLGMTIETVSRQLTQLETTGTIKRVGARVIAICDPARLKAVLEAES